MTPAKYLILNPIFDIFQMPKICALDHGAGRIYVCDRIYNTPSHLPLYYTEYNLKDTKEAEPKNQRYEIILDSEVEDFMIRAGGVT